MILQEKMLFVINRCGLHLTLYVLIMIRHKNNQLVGKCDYVMISYEM